MSEERKEFFFSKCGEGGKKCKFSDVRKEKKEIERKVPRKKIKVFFDVLGMKILLSSCSLVGFYCERGIFFKFEKKKFLGVCYPVSWAPCWLKSSIIWANWKVKVKIGVGDKNDCLLRKKKIDEIFSMYFSGRGLCFTHVGRHVDRKFNHMDRLKTGRFFENPLVGRHVVNDSKIT